MRPSCDTVPGSSGSFTSTSPASPSTGVSDAGANRVRASATAASIAARRSGVSSRSPSGAANTTFRTPPCSAANSVSIRSVAFWVSDPGMSNSSRSDPPTVATRAISTTMIPSQPRTVFHGL